MRTAYFSHPDCLLHDMGTGHPESPARLRAIAEHLRHSDLATRLDWCDAPLASREDLLLAHTSDYLAMLEGVAEHLQDAEHSGTPDNVPIDPDTSMNAHSWQAALRAVGAALAATDAVIDGSVSNAFCAVRPPGHHACHDHAMGFCLLNTVAIAARHALERHGLRRVAIVDFDVHHGNGTEDIVAGDARILMVGFYQHPFYPAGGARSQASNLCNIPVAADSDGQTVRTLCTQHWLPRLEAFAPEMVFISAGFDAHRDDALGQLGLQEADYAWLTEQIGAVAQRHAHGRIVSSLEGGYTLAALARSVEAHIGVLSDLSPNT